MSPGEQAGPGREGTVASDVSLRALEGQWKDSARWDRPDLCFFNRPSGDRRSGVDEKEGQWSPQSGHTSCSSQRKMPPGEELGVSREMEEERSPHLQERE